MAVGKKLKLRLFLEGVEVPVIHASVTCGVSRQATAEIHIVPSHRVRSLLPRTVVHLFYYDDSEILDDKRYKLLFAGEMTGYRYAKAEGGREAVLMCKDFTSYWDMAKRFYYDDLSFNSQKLAQSTFADAKRAPYDLLIGPSATLVSLIKRSCRTYPGLRGISSGLIRILESIGGYHEGGTHTRGVSDFFTAAQLRLKLYQQIGASDLDDTCTRLLDRKEFGRWLRSMLSQGGNMFSMRDVLNVVMEAVLYHYSSNPSAYYYKGQTVKKIGHTVAAAPPDVIKEIHGAMRHIEAVTSRLMMVSSDRLYRRITPVPWLDAVHPRELTGAQVSLLKAAAKKLGTYNKLVEGNAEYFVSSMSHNQMSTEDPVNHAESEFAPMASASPDPFWIPQADRERAALHLSSAMSKYHEFLIKFSDSKSWVETVMSPAEKLHTTLFMPDIFMCPPPRCNIIFPEHYERFSMERDFDAEVTRVMITTPNNVLGSSAGMAGIIGNLKHFAPLVDDIEGKNIKERIKRSQRFILPNEVYAGPHPYIQWFSDIRKYDPVLGWEGASALKEIHDEVSKAQEKERGVMDNLPYLQHYAEFMFMKMRYASRTVNVPMRFNPNLVAGLPAVVVDRFYDPSNTSEKATNEPPEHWLGVPAVIVHKIGQTYAYTIASLSYVRGHREDDDLFERIVERKFPVGKKKATKTVTMTTRDLLKIPKTLKVTSIKLQSNGTDFGTNIVKALAYAGIEVYNMPGSKVAATGITLEGMSATNHTDLTAEVTGTSKFKYVVKYSYMKTTYETRKATIPFEDQVRPPWLAPVFLNSNIGEFYNELIGVGSIINITVPSASLEGEPTHIGGGDSLGFMKGLSDIYSAAGVTKATNPGELFYTSDGSSVVSALTSEENSVAASVDDIVKHYSIARTKGTADLVDVYIDTITRRPIATMDEILGDAELTYDDKTFKVTHGKEGFHSAAFGEIGSLKDLGGSVPMESDTTHQDHKVTNATMDPRPERRKRVLAYRDSLDTPLVG